MPPPGDHATTLPTARDARLETVERLARLLDGALRVPGTRIRLGADAALNLLPGIGPVAAKGLSAVIVWQAHRLGAPPRLLLRMVGNVALDAVVGAVPLAGWVADIFLRANSRNLALLRAHLEAAPPVPTPAAARFSPAAA